MYKKLLYYTMFLNTVLIFLALITLIVMGKLILPVMVIANAVILGLLGIVLIVRHFVLKGTRKYQLLFYHLLQIIVSGANLFLVAKFPMEIRFIDVFIIGTLVHIFISALLGYLTVHEHRSKIARARYMKSKSGSL